MKFDELYKTIVESLEDSQSEQNYYKELTSELADEMSRRLGSIVQKFRSLRSQSESEGYSSFDTTLKLRKFVEFVKRMDKEADQLFSNKG
jgi:hypothetical protein